MGSGDPKDVERLLMAGLYTQAMADRRAKNGTDAARLIAEMATRFPNDTSVQLMRVESLLLDSQDAFSALNAARAVSVDETAKVWRAEIRIPLKSLADTAPAAGTRWRINLYRHDAAAKVGLAFSPTLRGTFHTPQRFGWLEFTP